MNLLCERGEEIIFLFRSDNAKLNFVNIVIAKYIVKFYTNCPITIKPIS